MKKPVWIQPDLEHATLKQLGTLINNATEEFTKKLKKGRMTFSQ